MLERVPNLPWPANLFSLPHLLVATETTAPLFAGAGKKVLGDKLCTCGCKLPHNNAVSGLEGEAGYRRVNWYRTIGCKNKHLRPVS
jgi:hypothetical protein